MASSKKNRTKTALPKEKKAPKVKKERELTGFMTSDDLAEGDRNEVEKSLSHQS